MYFPNSERLIIIIIIIWFLKKKGHYLAYLLNSEFRTLVKFVKYHFPIEIRETYMVEKCVQWAKFIGTSQLIQTPISPRHFTEKQNWKNQRINIQFLKKNTHIHKLYLKKNEYILLGEAFWPPYIQIDS